MSAGPTDTIWPAEPHTIAKIAILKAYLVAYFQILGRSRRQSLLYIDGFAGPNKYSNHEFGSPTAALDAANTAKSKAAGVWIANGINYAFVESNKDRFDHLVASLPSSDAGLVIHTYNAEFTEALPQIKRDVPEPFNSNSPLFAFIDPFGATGAPFSCVSEILDSPCSEVLINLDVDGIGRILKAGDSANYEKLLTEIFGTDDWRDKLQSEQPLDALSRNVLKLYKERLGSLPGVRYLFQVEMRGTSDTLNYFLVFASKHPLGLIKMKEAMGKIAQNGTYTFADADIGQEALLRFDAPEEYHMRLFEQFKGQTVEYDSQKDDITAFALNHTPFTNAKKMLELLEKEGLITAISSPSRSRGTFNESVTAISFHERAQHGFPF